MRIAVDMDEVIADAFSRHFKWLVEAYGYSWTHDMFAGRHFSDLADPTHIERLEAVKQDGHLFGDLPVMEGAQQALESISRKAEVFITTAALEYPASCGPKYQWLKRNFAFIPDSNIVFCGDKSVVSADMLIDDHSRHFRNFRGVGVLFDAFHNKNDTWPIRVNGWGHAEQFVSQFLEKRL